MDLNGNDLDNNLINWESIYEDENNNDDESGMFLTLKLNPDNNNNSSSHTPHLKRILQSLNIDESNFGHIEIAQ